MNDHPPPPPRPRPPILPDPVVRYSGPGRERRDVLAAAANRRSRRLDRRKAAVPELVEALTFLTYVAGLILLVSSPAIVHFAWQAWGW